MSVRANSPNHFLASITSSDYDLIEPHLRPVDLRHGVVLYRAEEEIERVYFPHSGVVSLVVGFSDGRFVEAGMFGRNGVIGGGAALDGRKAINQAVVQAPGAGLSIEIGQLTQLASQRDTLRKALMSHELIVHASAQQVAACNATHHLEERLCRWLMQTRDLLKSNELPLTQEFLAQMLGVQRSSVTVIAGKLQESGLLKYRRGHIQIRNVEGLRDACCECYEIMNRHFEQLVGWRPGLDDGNSRADR